VPEKQKKVNGNHSGVCWTGEAATPYDGNRWGANLVVQQGSSLSGKLPIIDRLE
jgi:hypothetical protein